jgi:hypothetical protein
MQWGLIAMALFVSGCAQEQKQVAQKSTQSMKEAAKPSAWAVKKHVSSNFWQHWGDGKAELSGYRMKVKRYGETREGLAALIYVTEDLHRDTLIKDDKGNLPDDRKIPVIKLNQSVKFQTGIYPYSLMTSVFSPVHHLQGRAPFDPVKISFSAQEWCGHVFEMLWPTAAAARFEQHSYFQDEGDRTEEIQYGANTLFEDALFIQLRELDGPLFEGDVWEGQIVPARWENRKAHRRPRPEKASIKRHADNVDGAPVNRFEVRIGERTLTVMVEKAVPHRILRFKKSDGDEGTLLKTARLPYWEHNHRGAEKFLAELGLK